MSKSQRKSRRIPTVSEDRITESADNTAIGTTKEEQRAHAFIKGREPTQPLTLRLPISLHQKLREVAFKSEDKITHIILRAVREHVKTLEEQEKNLESFQSNRDKEDT